MLYHQVLDTPTGPLTVLLTDAGVVRASGFTDDVDVLLSLVHPRLRAPTTPAAGSGPVAVAVRSYFDGDLTALDAVPVEQHSGGAFLTHAWQVMREIKPGHPLTYAQYAALAGRPAAVRAAATACARNAAAPFVPCHRVVGSDGQLRGYRWGLDVKRFLLEHERV